MNEKKGFVKLKMTAYYIAKHSDDDIQEYKRPWVGLTEEESSDIYNAHHNTYGECITSAHDLVLDVEAALRSKNHD